MTHRSNEKPVQPLTQKSHNDTDESNHLPDVIADDEELEVCDLPRQGIPKDVLDVSKASERLPELLMDD